MDALALLCTLHADGPATLRNLRLAGCESIHGVESMAEERLSRLLGGPPAVARRFAREARHLRDRIGQALPDREEAVLDAPVPGTVAPEPWEGGLPFGAEVGVPTVDEEAQAQAPAGLEEARDPIAEVLEAWCQRDQEDASVGEAALEGTPQLVAAEGQEDEIPPRPVRARPEFEFGTAITAAFREIASAVAASGGETMAVTTLSGPPPGSIDGLDEHLSRSLAEAGIGSLADLAATDAFALSQALGIGFTRMQRFVLLARRATAEASKARLLEAIPETNFASALLEPAGIDPAKPGADARAAFGASEEPGTARPSTEKISPSERPGGSGPSILELEWNLELRPRPAPGSRSQSEGSARDPERESASGPFA